MCIVFFSFCGAEMSNNWIFSLFVNKHMANYVLRFNSTNYISSLSDFIGTRTPTPYASQNEKENITYCTVVATVRGYLIVLSKGCWPISSSFRDLFFLSFALLGADSEAWSWGGRGSPRHRAGQLSPGCQWSAKSKVRNVSVVPSRRLKPCHWHAHCPCSPRSEPSVTCPVSAWWEP